MSKSCSSPIKCKSIVYRKVKLSVSHPVSPLVNKAIIEDRHSVVEDKCTAPSYKSELKQKKVYKRSILDFVLLFLKLLVGLKSMFDYITDTKASLLYFLSLFFSFSFFFIKILRKSFNHTWKRKTTRAFYISSIICEFLLLIIFISNNLSDCPSRTDNFHYLPSSQQRLEDHNRNAITKNFPSIYPGNQLNLNSVFRFDIYAKKDLLQDLFNQCKYFDNSLYSFPFFSPILNAFYIDFLKLICTIIVLYIFTRFLTFNFSYNSNRLHFVNFLGRFLNFFTIAFIFISLVILSYIISCIFISGTFMNQQENKFKSGFVNFTSKNTDLETKFFSKLVLTIAALVFFRLSCNKRANKSSLLFVSVIALVIIKYHHSRNNEEAKNYLKNCTKVIFYCNESICVGNLIKYLDSQNDLIFLVLPKENYRCHNSKISRRLLYLSGDIEVNPGPNVRDIDIWEPLKKRGLHFIHININSILPKIDELREIAKNTKAAIIGITESKLDSTIDDMEVCITGYSVLRCDRNRKGGGVACFVRNDLCFNRESHFNCNIEHVFLKIFIPKLKPILIGIFYRPPTQRSFLETLIKDFETLNLDNKEIYILGDFNINLIQNNIYILKEHESSISESLMTPLVNQYKELCQKFSLKQMLREPTRITCNSSTLLDHILSNSDEKISNSGIIDLGISDHHLTYCTRKILRFKSNSHQNVLLRCLKNYDADKFVKVLEEAKFPNYDLFSDVDVAYADLLKRLSTSIDSIAPLKETRIKNMSEDWFDRELHEKIKKRNILLKKFRKSKLQIDEDLYKSSKYNIDKLIKEKKKTFYKSKLEQNIGRPKELWKTLKSLGLPSKKASTSKIFLKEGEKISYDDANNASIFKTFYSSLADNLLAKLPSPSGKYGINSVKSYYKNSLSTKFNISQLETQNVLEILQSLNSEKAAGIDNIPCKFLKDGANILAKHICQICNLSIKQSLFPHQCKIAKIKPLFKKGSKTDPKNYRPISLLPLISKIIERVIFDQTQEFLQKQNVFCRYQSGFRKNYSTDLCLSYLCDKVKKGFDCNLFTGMILIDLQKSFDTINHEILIKKMECIGFSEETLSWFKSYLSHREFKVSINKSLSNSGKITCGVPQGSILGPLLFLLYINDIPQAVECEILLYADDTCLLFQHKNVKDIEKQLNKDFSNLCEWFVDNKLSVHFGEDKTKCILFGSKYKIKKADTLDIEYNNIKIKQYRKVTYLGCILDSTLSGESMALNVLNKINGRLKFLYRQENVLDKSLRRLLCNAMIQPFFDYACSAWYPHLNKSMQDRLQSAQNKCIKFCLKIGCRTSVKTKDFEAINWLNVHDRFFQIMASTVFRFFKNCGPEYLDEIYFPADQIGMCTRFSYQKLQIPRRKTNMGMKSLSYVAPTFWNTLPTSLKLSVNLNNFKHKIKDYFFDRNK